jgi:hypothetical protein
VNITGLLVDLGSAENMDFRQHFMCWQLTRVLRPSLAEKVSPSVVRSVVDQQTARSRTVSPSHRFWRAGSPSSPLSRMQMQGEASVAATGDGDRSEVVGDVARAGLPHQRWAWATSDPRKLGYVGDHINPDAFADSTTVSRHQELCRTAQRTCV